MKRKMNSTSIISKMLLLLFILSNSACVSMNALKDINTNPENASRGDPLNTGRAKIFLEEVLVTPDLYEVKAFHRRAYSPENKKTMFRYHSFYVFLKENKLEHTLVFSASPKNSKIKGSWILDAQTDIDSYYLYLESDNPWELEEYVSKKHQVKLDLIGTTKSVLKRIDKEYSFSGVASVRNYPFYHMLWISLAPPPILSVVFALIFTRKSDNCNSAILETLVWEES